MDRTTRYAALNTKVRALEGKLLKDEDYINLLAKRGVPDVAEYLKQNTHYSGILDNVNTVEIHRGSLENLLKESHINGLKKIVHYFYGNYREFFKVLFIKYEIEDLKIILRGIKTGRENIKLKNSLKYIGEYSKINFDSLLVSKSINEFIGNLKGTVYYDYLRPLSDNKGNIELFSIEMILDLAYFDLFYKNLKLIDKEDRAVMEDIQGVYVDLLNIQWIYRGLKFYSLAPEELFNYTIAYGREFSRNDIKELCYIKNLEEFQKRILSTKYSFLFDVENTRDIFMERRILRYQYFYLKRIKTGQSLNISSPMIYNSLEEYEIRDIITIIESIRYEMPLNEAKKFLIRKL